VSRLALAAVLAAIAALSAAPAAHAYALDGIPWPGRPATITYWNGTAYGSQLARAVRAWNESGARVRFRAAPKRRARLQIVYDAFADPERELAGIAHGRASVGYQPRNRVALGRGARGAGAIGVIAHELGHVLGLVHEDRHCSLMNPLPWLRCAPASSCSILRYDDVRGAIRRYGGKVRARRAEMCPPQPASLSLSRVPESGRIEALVALPQGDIAGVLTKRAVGRCPDRPTSVTEGREGAAGSVLRIDVTPRGNLVPMEPQQLCVSAWTFDPTGRVSATALTRQIELAPVSAP
jgi:hypothetical protein